MNEINDYTKYMVPFYAPASFKVKKALGKTETAGSDFTFFQQIFSNLRSGRFASVE